MSNLLNFPGAEERASRRLTAIHLGHLGLNAFAADLGTPDEWLESALVHVKSVIPSGNPAGTVTVSAAALSLIIMMLEEQLFDGPKVVLPIDG